MLTSNLFSTLFMAKMTSAGNLVWSKTDGTATDESNSISVDSKGFFYLSGWTSGQSNFSGNILLNGMFVAKYDSSGNAAWVRGGNSAIAFQTAIDQHGSVFVSGQFSGSTFTSPGNNITLSTNKQCEIFVIKYDQNGNLKWGIAPTGPFASGNSAYSIVHDQIKHVYITGSISGNTTFSTTTLTNSNQWNIFMAKLNDSIAPIATGSIENARTLGAILMPNPGSAQSKLLLSSSAPLHSSKVEILSTDWRKLCQYDVIDKPELTLDLTNLSRGLYFVRVIGTTAAGERHTQTIKLIVN